MHFSRRRKGITDYRKRLALLKSGIPRAVVRFTNSKIMVQNVTLQNERKVDIWHSSFAPICLILEDLDHKTGKTDVSGQNVPAEASTHG